MKPGPKRTKNWGLTPCPTERACAVCTALGDRPEELQRLREMYVEGMPPWLLAHTFGIPNSAVRSHAFRKNWCRRRSYNLPDPKAVVYIAALARLRDTWHLADGHSADRMLALLAKLTGDEAQGQY